jgi:hypothetical protein
MIKHVFPVIVEMRSTARFEHTLCNAVWWHALAVESVVDISLALLLCDFKLF